jgi:hypothetical protein
MTKDGIEQTFSEILTESLPKWTTATETGHLDAESTWTRIRFGRKFTSSETKHLKACHLCSSWVTTFVDINQPSSLSAVPPKRVSKPPR